MEVWLDELVQQLPAHVLQTVKRHKKRGTMISFAQNCGDGGVVLPRDWGANRLNGDELQSWLLSWIKTHFMGNSTVDKLWIATSIEKLWSQLLAQLIERAEQIWIVPPLAPEVTRLLKDKKANIKIIKPPAQLDWLQRQFNLQAPACIIAGSGSQQVINWLNDSEVTKFINCNKLPIIIDQTTTLHPIILPQSPFTYNIYSLQKLWFPDISLAWIVGTEEVKSLAEHNDDFMNDKQGVVSAQRLHYKLTDPLFSWETHLLQLEEIYEARAKLMLQLMESEEWHRCKADQGHIVKEGIYIWFPLRSDLQARHLLQAAMLQGVDFWYIAKTYKEGDGVTCQEEQWLRFNYAAYPEAIIKKGISILQEILEDFTARSC
ncbi:hypothetical protein J2Z32_001907 [Paenibacillus turicensis]|uniref:Aminotransferase class I/classII domain-containing protein n=1 Tax=Paenibacillus turicensis TaxID=160487 RepID=A0ABS4FS93_9BACL|nr:hypothetical protein [Paenibacillus turicensis]MBP1905279.1 hypothetical protein [Paenibacillus turicensis]